MNALLDKKFLSDIGVTLDETHYQALSEQYDQTLEERIIEEITNELDETQLTELHAYRSKSDEELQAWLVRNVPQLSEIIEDEVAILLGEIAENSDRF